MSDSSMDEQTTDDLRECRRILRIGLAVASTPSLAALFVQSPKWIVWISGILLGATVTIYVLLPLIVRPKDSYGR